LSAVFVGVAVATNVASSNALTANRLPFFGFHVELAPSTRVE
jgi:hypothetical protein